MHGFKKTCYNSGDVFTLLLLKAGLKSWKNKTHYNKKTTFFQSIEKISQVQTEKMDEEDSYE